MPSVVGTHIHKIVQVWVPALRLVVEPLIQPMKDLPGQVLIQSRMMLANPQ